MAFFATQVGQREVEEVSEGRGTNSKYLKKQKTVRVMKYSRMMVSKAFVLRVSERTTVDVVARDAFEEGAVTLDSVSLVGDMVDTPVPRASALDMVSIVAGAVADSASGTDIDKVGSRVIVAQDAERMRRGHCGQGVALLIARVTACADWSSWL